MISHKSLFKKYSYLIFSLLFLSVNAHSATKIDKMEVQGDLVIFTTIAAKTSAAPECMSSDHSNQWALNLTTNEGIELYSFLLIALSSSASIDITPANDCQGTENYERVLSLSLSV